jgi:hypothetical protein
MDQGDKLSQPDEAILPGRERNPKPFVFASNLCFNN